MSPWEVVSSTKTGTALVGTPSPIRVIPAQWVFVALLAGPFMPGQLLKPYETEQCQRSPQEMLEHDAIRLLTEPCLYLLHPGICSMA